MSIQAQPVTTRSQVQLAANRLFSADALAATNIKLYPGSDRETNADQYAEQINKAIAQIHAGDFDIIDVENLD